MIGMGKSTICNECGAQWENDVKCEDHFYQMLYWEAENLSFIQVHHLAVLSYYLQHPSLYSPEGLNAAKQLLAEIIEEGITPAAARKRVAIKFEIANQKPKIKAREDAKGSYKEPVKWSMVAGDVVAGGETGYCENIRKWSQYIYETLKDTGNN